MAREVAENARLTAIHAAIKIAGSQSALARIAGVSPQAVSKWCNGGRVSAESAMRIERSTKVSKQQTCPEVFGQTRKASAIQGRSSTVIVDELPFHEVGSASGTTPAVQIAGIFNRVRAALRIISRGTL